MATKRPNILIIMADQMTALALPPYGHTVVRAPYVESLAAGGVVFENAYCNSPLCAPSRASMMTGLLPSRIGAYDNAAEFPSDVPTFAHYLRDLGYHTCLSGKMHFIGPDQLHGFEERLTTDIYPADYGWTPDWEHPEGHPSWYHNMLSVVQAGPCQTSNQLDFDEEVAFHAVRKIQSMARGDRDRPFCLVTSFTHPHDPFAITQPYWDRYRQEEVDMPSIPPLRLNSMDPHSRRVHHVCGLGEYRQTDERVRNARHAYYSMISYVDDKIGQLLQSIESTGFVEDTVVILVSDHGEMLGERGLWYKMNFFEWSARVPLLIHAPTRYAPKRVPQIVSLVDLLPTLVEIAGGSTGDLIGDSDGRSLVPAIQGQAEHAERRAYGEILCESAIAPCLMIRRGSYKYVFSQPDPEQLYDLESAPRELHNLAGHVEYEEVISRFREELAQQWNPVALREQVVASQRRRRLIDHALRTGRYAAWDHQPFIDASEMYMRNHLDLNDLERRARFPTPPLPPPDIADPD